MSMFVEVDSVEKGCPVIINLEHIVEIAPLKEGGCALFLSDAGGVGTKVSMKVSDNYELFKQFAMQTVTAEDIAKKFPKAEPKKSKKDEDRFSVDFADIPKL